jgi:hypothetical protein
MSDKAKAEGWEFQTRRMTVAVCPVCEFGFDAAHVNDDGELVCPVCEGQKYADQLHSHMAKEHPGQALDENGELL